MGEAPDLPSLAGGANGTLPSLLSENERQSFLEWILSLTGGGTTTQEPDLAPVVPTQCAACSECDRPPANSGVQRDCLPSRRS